MFNHIVFYDDQDRERFKYSVYKLDDTKFNATFLRKWKKIEIE